MSALDHCHKEKVQLDHRDGKPWFVEAYRYGDFCLDDRFGEGDCWVLTHLPTGFGLFTAGGVFETAEDGAEAMVAIQALRNDWAVIGATEVTCDLYARVRSVCEFNGGQAAYGAGWGFSNGDPARLNGYGEAVA